MRMNHPQPHTRVVVIVALTLAWCPSLMPQALEWMCLWLFFEKQIQCAPNDCV